MTLPIYNFAFNSIDSGDRLHFVKLNITTKVTNTEESVGTIGDVIHVKDDFDSFELSLVDSEWMELINKSSGNSTLCYKRDVILVREI